MTRKRSLEIPNLDKRPNAQEEFLIQCALANHLRYNHQDVLFTIAPSGIFLPVWIGAKFKAMGYRKGTTDMLILEPRGIYHGLLLEVKKVGGQLSQDGSQASFLIAADARGYKAVCCMGYDIAVKTIDAYLNMGRE